MACNRQAHKPQHMWTESHATSRELPGAILVVGRPCFTVQVCTQLSVGLSWQEQSTVSVLDENFKEVARCYRCMLFVYMFPAFLCEPREITALWRGFRAVWFWIFLSFRDLRCVRKYRPHIPVTLLNCGTQLRTRPTNSAFRVTMIMQCGQLVQLLLKCCHETIVLMAAAGSDARPSRPTSA